MNRHHFIEYYPNAILMYKNKPLRMHMNEPVPTLEEAKSIIRLWDCEPQYKLLISWVDSKSTTIYTNQNNVEKSFTTTSIVNKKEYEQNYD